MGKFALAEKLIKAGTISGSFNGQFIAALSQGLCDKNGTLLAVASGGKLLAADLVTVLAGTTVVAKKALTDAATITWALDPTQDVQWASVTLGGNRTLAFSGAKPGMTGYLLVTQDGTGSRTLALPATSVKTGTPSTTAAYTDLFSFQTPDGSNFYWVVNPHMA